MISTSRCKVLTVMLATYSRGSGLAIFDIALELAGRQLRRRSKISTFEQHLFYVAIDQAHVRSLLIECSQTLRPRNRIRTTFASGQGPRQPEMVRWNRRRIPRSFHWRLNSSSGNGGNPLSVRPQQQP